MKKVYAVQLGYEYDDEYVTAGVFSSRAAAENYVKQYNFYPDAYSISELELDNPVKDVYYLQRYMPEE